MPPSPVPARLWTSGVWSGSEFLVFGGALDNPAYNPTNTGARFDPTTQTWRAMSTAGAPSAHSQQLAWTGGELLVYGGAVQLSPTAGGARYAPATDTWRPISTMGQPSARLYGVALWLGARWFVWGGYGAGHLSDGFLYDPVADSWQPIATAGAPSPRSFAKGVWTGTEVIVWGGCDGPMGACPGVKADGARWELATNTWHPISTVGAPSARADHVSGWTGKEMIVFGGATGGSLTNQVNDGALYDPATDTWRPMSGVGAPSARAAGGAAWLVDHFIVWGPFPPDGYLYDPATDVWSQMTLAGAPASRQRFAFAVADRRVFVWGGFPLDGTGAVWTSQ